MMHSNPYRLCKRQNAAPKGMVFPASWRGILAVLVWLVAGQAQAAPEKLAAQTKSPQSASIYDPNPNHLWNRLFVTFYRQKILSYADHDRQKTVANWVGPDVLDPPLGYHPRFLLDDEAFAKCDAVLDEFLSQHGDERIREPLKRAVLQRDLWAVFDVLAITDPTPRIYSSIGSSQTSATALQEQHRSILERKIARVIRSLALSSMEIKSLPDTYSAAIQSGAFSNKLQNGGDNFLPGDLFTINTAWFEVQPEHLLTHSLMVGGRSVFRVFVKSPAGFTNVLEDHVRNLDDWRRQYQAWATLWRTNHAMAGKMEPQRPSGELPVGTQFLLLREMICLDENLQMIPTHIVESVQFRTTYKKGFLEHQVAREAELNRALLFQGKQGGLKPIAAGELRNAAYDGLGNLVVDDQGNGSPLIAFPQNCIACHQSRLLFSNTYASAKPRLSISIEPISRWKEKNGKLDQLRDLILSSTSNKR
jgi:hypothetical protein